MGDNKKQAQSSDKEDQSSKLPDYAILYFRHLESELKYLKKIAKSSEAILVASKDGVLKHAETAEAEYTKRDEGADNGKGNTDGSTGGRRDIDLSWNDLFALELEIAGLLPRERLGREVWRLRSRYRDVVGLTQYEAYLASNPPDLTPDEKSDNEVRADMEYLLSEIYLRYLTNPYNEELRNLITQRVTILILTGMVIVILMATFFNKFTFNSLGPATLLLVLFLGGVGGLLSMQQRYQSVSREGDPLDNIAVLKQNWARLFMPAISGAVFASMLYMVLIGKLVEGDLFPDLKLPEGMENHKELLDAIRNSSPAGVKDYAKLIVWSFLAGFAERLVPDTLSRFSLHKDSTVQEVKRKS